MPEKKSIEFDKSHKNQLNDSDKNSQSFDCKSAAEITLKVILNLVLLMAATADILWVVRTWMVIFLILLNFLNEVMAYDSCAVIESQISQCVDWQPLSQHQNTASSQNEKTSSQSHTADIHVCPCLMILNDNILTYQQPDGPAIYQSYLKIQWLSNFSNPLYRPPITTVS